MLEDNYNANICIIDKEMNIITTADLKFNSKRFNFNILFIISKTALH